MGILDRFSDIIRANINDLLDKAEDPSKMIDQYLRDLTEDLAEVKKETAGVMAQETRTKRDFEENAAEVTKYADLAKKALKAGNEGDARTLIEKKQELEAKGAGLETTYKAAAENAKKMREMHDKLVKDIETLNSRREGIKAKVAVAKTQEKINEFSDGAEKAAATMNAFDRMEDKADEMLDRANAESELNQKPVDSATSVAEKYKIDSASVDDELAKMKSELGL